MRDSRFARWAAAFAVAVTAAIVVAGCSGSGTTPPDSGGNSLTINGNVPIAYAKRSTSLNVNPTNGAPFAEGGDLMIRELSSPSAREFNVTAAITQGNGDVSDPEVSYDGKKIVFAMRCPTSNTSSVGGVAACTGHWNIWEYDMSPGLSSGIFRRITSSTTDDDVDPAYLPADRGFVFSSNRQTTTKSQALGQSYFQVDEYERERVFNLHTVDRNGGAVTQISVNQSHDRNPVVRPNGDILFSRWEHVGPRNRFAIFRVKPDGTDMFVLYGAHSGGNSFLHPRDMDPRGAYAGKVVSSLMPLSGTQEGGALMLIDAANFSEQNTPANAQVVVGKGGQVQWTDKEIDLGRGLSEFGRITAPFPLWDGTDRVLLAYRPCEVTRNGVVVPCATLTAAERAMLADDTMSRAQQALLPVQDNAPAVYSIYMVDPAKQTFLIVAAPPSGFMYTDPVAIQPRPEPNATQPTVVDETLKAQNLALIEVRSVYDTDGLDRMGESVLAPVDLQSACSVGIAKTAPVDAADTRSQVPDIVKIKDPADPAYRCAPAYFVRAIRAVAPQVNAMGMREAIGETEFEPQQILGYAPVEPDGSFKLHVPADTPLGLCRARCEGPCAADAPELDPGAAGRAPHLRWLPQPAAWRVAEFGRDRQRNARGADAGDGDSAPVRRDDGIDPNAARCECAQARRRSCPYRQLGRYDPGRRDRAPDHHRALHRQYERRRRPRDAGPDERDHQLPRPHPADLDTQPRYRWRQHLHQLSQRHRKAGPARDGGRQRPAGVL